MLNVDGAFTEYQSFLANGSVLFFKPFLPLDSLLFLPTAMIAVMCLNGETMTVVNADLLQSESVRDVCSAFKNLCGSAKPARESRHFP